MDPTPHTFGRRTLFTGAGVLAAGAALTRLGGARPAPAPAAPLRLRPAAATTSTRPVVKRHLVATDGWVSMPADAPADPPFFPDALAPSPFNTYVFGFRDATSIDPNADPAFDITKLNPLKGHAQISAPLMGFDEETDIYLALTNLGLAQRPDLVDGHTLHWHGFQNAIPLFDGVPELSMSVPIGRSFTYFYRPHDAGTYMYHCHFEDVEHVQMGMTGMVFVRPKQNAGTAAVPPGKYAYNDGDGSTRYDREFSIFLTELWSAAHYRDAHIQTNDWTDYAASFWLMNGRAYPDTVAPAGDPLSTAAGRLQYQPITSLIRANAGDRVLLRLANLGYQNHALTLDGISMRMVAKDASLLVGRDGTKDYADSTTVDIAPGESRDVLITAPDSPGTYLLYDRNYAYQSNGGGAGYGGQMTKLEVSPRGTLPAQTAING
jgi:FtsP/CotA-like multicopper oxidase with cupredoxin domain